jgi:hypothetical protein
MLGTTELGAISRDAERKVRKMRNSHDNGSEGSINRRSFLGVTGAVAVARLAGGLSVQAAANRTTQAHMSGRRKLGSLEVSIRVT